MQLRIIVCIKAVSLSLPQTGKSRPVDAIELNPFDRPSLETALRLREAYGGTVTALSMGPISACGVLSEARAMGVDQLVLVSDPVLAGSDTLATSSVLAAAINRLAPFDLVVFGTRSADSDTGQVGPQTATLLELPLVTGVRSVSRDNAVLHVERISDGFMEQFELTLPAALTIHSGSVQPRDVDLYGIESAFSEPRVTIWQLNDLSVPSDQVGEAGSPTRVTSLSKMKKDRKCEFISGTAEEQAEALIHRLVESGAIG
ncbi:MAG: electron transfer flavoprotein subunit beta/FixA family protein [Desulfobacterales bacterium]|nr:electron transfer flavoprotein subunit beta/FixA family protein [Desulfobacterales bacterium]